MLKKQRIFETLLLLLFMVFMGLCTGLCTQFIQRADGQIPALEAQEPGPDLPWPEWDEKSIQNLGRCLRGESDLRESDYAPISHVLVKLWRITSVTKGWDINEQITRYCLVFKRRSRRSSRIAASTWEEPLFGKAREWDRLRVWCLEFVKGIVPDPIPLAEHWGGKMDDPPMNSEVVSAPPLTANTFYRKIPKKRCRRGR